MVVGCDVSELVELAVRRAAWHGRGRSGQTVIGAELPDRVDIDIGRGAQLLHVALSQVLGW